MRARALPLLAAIAALPFAASSGPAASAAEEPSEVHVSLLKNESRKKLVAYIEESRKRLLEIDTIMAKPADDPDDESRNIFLDIVEEDEEEMADALAAITDVERSKEDEDAEEDPLGEVEAYFDEMRAHWTDVRALAGRTYDGGCRLQRDRELVEKVTPLVQDFIRWFRETARTLDEVLIPAARAYESRNPAEIRRVLPVLERHLYTAKMMDAVWESHATTYEEWLENIDEDPYADYWNALDEWTLDPGRAPTFAAHRQRWKDASQALYTEGWKEVEELSKLLRTVVAGEMLVGVSYQWMGKHKIGNWGELWQETIDEMKAMLDER